MSRRRFLGALLGASLLVGISGEAFAFSASFRWCSGSPAFTLNGVPKAAAKLEFDMTDLDKPSFRHGGGTIAYSGQKSVPCGALSNFVPPAPPHGQVHTYEFSIKAIGGSGETLGETSARRKFPE